MKKRVAFVCVHNSCRSQIAEALGKIYGKSVQVMIIPIMLKIYFSSILNVGKRPKGLIQVAVSISLFGLQSGATLATVVGVLVEVLVMLTLVKISNSTRKYFR